MEMASFEIINPIVTKERPRARVVNGQYAQIYTPKKTASYENLVKLIYQRSCWQYFGESPLKVTIIANFTCPNGLEKYVDWGLKCVKHKDLDNIAKTILDALNGVAYKDDKQVQELNVIKRYSDRDYEYVSVEIEDVYGTLEEAKIAYSKHVISTQINKLEQKEKLTQKEQKRLDDLKLKLEKLNLFIG